MADLIKKEVYTIKLTYEMTINVDTGELIETRLIDRTVDNSDIKTKKSSNKKKIIQDEDEEPKLFLEENKYRLNNAAVKLMHLEADAKLNIKYEQGENGDTPIIGTSEAFGVKEGNKITGSNTVAYRGAKNAELAKYGDEFIISPHPDKPELFILSSTSKKPVQEAIIDEKAKEDIGLPFDLDLIVLVNDEDSNLTEIDSNFFKL